VETPFCGFASSALIVVGRSTAPSDFTLRMIRDAIVEAQSVVKAHGPGIGTPAATG
jgi:hypothetical protein